MSLESKRRASANKRLERRTFAYALFGNKCCLCPSTEGLQFDHKDPSTKKLNVAEMWTHSLAKFLVELSKCQLLCKECHKKKTHKDLYPKRQHGMYSMYNRGGCRCPLCKEAYNKYMRDYKKRTRL